MLKRNLKEGRLFFTSDFRQACSGAEIIFIAVGTPPNADGSANLSFIKSAAENVAHYIDEEGVLIVTKSTVPVGTNRKVKEWISAELKQTIHFDVVSNPEFLREGSAIKDTFEADRIVIGASSEEAAGKLEKLYQPFKTVIVKTSIESAEMIKYASNAFLAAKISFINEISNLCESLDADIEEVAKGMGMDHRIGSAFLKAGIGYGGSCFPKDTNALVQLAGGIQHHFELLESVIRVNAKQQTKLVDSAIEHLGGLNGKQIALLGLSFKPNTDDIREAASIEMIQELLDHGADIEVYDPAAMHHVKKIFGNKISYAENPMGAVYQKDLVFIVTEWEEFRTLRMESLIKGMKTPVILDGRNCFSLEEARGVIADYISIGRPKVLNYSKIQAASQ